MTAQRSPGDRSVVGKTRAWEKSAVGERLSIKGKGACSKDYDVR